ncbi:hypothetical protein [Kitasatospora sp. NPDC017646]|uniref:hypothetical protein n=1 Tax=Kitasatospora sp. NPDC017646 TaxID=3364024 RepID=UPI0037A5DCDE
MTAVCPGCAAVEHALPVPEAVEGAASTGAVLAGPVAVHLAPPPRPVPRPVEASAAAAVLVVLAALGLLVGMLSLLRPQPQGYGGAAYRAGYVLGAVAGPALLTAAALVVRRVARRRGERREGERLEVQLQRWRHLVDRWRRGWWCRACQAAFFPAGALHPGAAPSPVIEARHYPAWVLGADAPGSSGGQGLS